MVMNMGCYLGVLSILGIWVGGIEVREFIGDDWWCEIKLTAMIVRSVRE